MNEPKININVMPGAQMNGYVKEQHNYFGNVQKITSSEAKENPVVHKRDGSFCVKKTKKAKNKYGNSDIES